MNKWKKAFKQAFNEMDWKETFMRLGEMTFFVMVTSLAYRLLIHYGVLNEVTNPWMVVGAWVVAFNLGDYAIGKHDEYLLRQRIFKAARKVAEEQGIDPKTLDYKNIESHEDENGVLKVTIRVKKG